jgi:hypothetical protein
MASDDTRVVADEFGSPTTPGALAKRFEHFRERVGEQADERTAQREA